jgi:hypothetical protein
MNLAEVDRPLRKLRLSGMADILETRLRQAQSDHMAPLDLVSALVADELICRQDGLFARRHKQAAPWTASTSISARRSTASSLRLVNRRP